jgi:polar amino acid transport system permease protein
MTIAVAFDPNFYFHFIFQPSPALINGVAITVIAAVVAQLIGTVVGTLSALAALSKRRILRVLSAFYVWFFRGVPTLVQIFLVYFGVPALTGFDPFPPAMGIGPLHVNGAIVAGIVALAVNEGAYMSEIVRAGILSVDVGQREAALAVGMTHRTAMRRIILPQAARVIVPPLGNDFNNMLKITSLLSVIGVEELFRVAQDTQAATFLTFESYLGAATYYLALLSIWAWIQRLIERKLDVAAVRPVRRWWSLGLGPPGMVIGNGLFRRNLGVNSTPSPPSEDGTLFPPDGPSGAPSKTSDTQPPATADRT